MILDRQLGVEVGFLAFCRLQLRTPFVFRRHVAITRLFIRMSPINDGDIRVPFNPGLFFLVGAVNIGCAGALIVFADAAWCESDGVFLKRLVMVYWLRAI